jgi:hypothetical protein
VLGLRLAADPAAGRVRQRARTASPERRAAETAEAHDRPGAGTGGVDRPFLDERGRLPDETLAPLAVGLGAAVAATGAIFGPAPVVVGVLPLAWGAWAWLQGASEELAATADEELAATASDLRPADRHAAASVEQDRPRTP